MSLLKLFIDETTKEVSLLGKLTRHEVKNFLYKKGLVKVEEYGRLELTVNGKAKLFDIGVTIYSSYLAFRKYHNIPLEFRTMTAFEFVMDMDEYSENVEADLYDGIDLDKYDDFITELKWEYGMKSDADILAEIYILFGYARDLVANKELH